MTDAALSGELVSGLLLQFQSLKSEEDCTSHTRRVSVYACVYACERRQATWWSQPLTMKVGEEQFMQSTTRLFGERLSIPCLDNDADVDDDDDDDEDPATMGGCRVLALASAAEPSYPASLSLSVCPCSSERRENG